MAQNPRKLLYLSLTDKLKVLKTSGLVKRIDRWNNQIEKESVSGASKNPSVLIQISQKFDPSPASNYSLQFGEVVIEIHVGISINDKYKATTKDWDIFQGIHECLQGFMPTGDDNSNFTRLDRIDEKEDNDYDGYYHGVVSYGTHLNDCTGDAGQGKFWGDIDTLDETVNKVDEV